MKRKDTRGNGSDSSDDSQSSSSEEEEKTCSSCNGDNDENQMVECRRCQFYYHIFCLTPPLTRVPRGTWVCDDCESKKKRIQRSKERDERVKKREIKKKKNGNNGNNGSRSHGGGGRRNSVDNSKRSNNSDDDEDEDDDEDGEHADDDSRNKKRRQLKRRKKSNNDSDKESDESGSDSVSSGSDDSSDEEDHLNDLVCTKCNQGKDEDKILLCDGDGCDRGYHMYCLRYPITSVPKGDWICDHCRWGDLSDIDLNEQDDDADETIVFKKRKEVYSSPALAPLPSTPSSSSTSTPSPPTSSPPSSQKSTDKTNNGSEPKNNGGEKKQSHSNNKGNKSNDKRSVSPPNKNNQPSPPPVMMLKKSGTGVGGNTSKPQSGNNNNFNRIQEMNKKAQQQKQQEQSTTNLPSIINNSGNNKKPVVRSPTLGSDSDSVNSILDLPTSPIRNVPNISWDLNENNHHSKSQQQQQPQSYVQQSTYQQQQQQYKPAPFPQLINSIGFNNNNNNHQHLIPKPPTSSSSSSSNPTTPKQQSVQQQQQSIQQQLNQQFNQQPILKQQKLLWRGKFIYDDTFVTMMNATRVDEIDSKVNLNGNLVFQKCNSYSIPNEIKQVLLRPVLMSPDHPLLIFQPNSFDSPNYNTPESSPYHSLLLKLKLPSNSNHPFNINLGCMRISNRKHLYIFSKQQQSIQQQQQQSSQSFILYGIVYKKPKSSSTLNQNEQQLKNNNIIKSNNEQLNQPINYNNDNIQFTLKDRNVVFVGTSTFPSHSLIELVVDCGAQIAMDVGLLNIDESYIFIVESGYHTMSMTKDHPSLDRFRLKDCNIFIKFSDSFEQYLKQQKLYYNNNLIIPDGANLNNSNNNIHLNNINNNINNSNNNSNNNNGNGNSNKMTLDYHQLLYPYHGVIMVDNSVVIENDLLYQSLLPLVSNLWKIGIRWCVQVFKSAVDDNLNLMINNSQCANKKIQDLQMYRKNGIVDIDSKATVNNNMELLMEARRTTYRFKYRHVLLLTSDHLLTTHFSTNQFESPIQCLVMESTINYLKKLMPSSPSLSNRSLIN